jgi:hypothetical protein
MSQWNRSDTVRYSTVRYDTFDTKSKGEIMARAGVTFEQVTAIADTIAGEGHRPTIRLVRERLGNTGSPNTVHKHLIKWQETRPAAVCDAPQSSQTLADAIAAEIARIAAASRSEITGRLAHAQMEAAELASVGEVLEAEREVLLNQVADLTAERDALAVKLAHLAADLAEARQCIERELKATEAARVELATARVRAEQQVKVEAEQSAEILQLRDAQGREHEARISADQLAAVLSARLEAMNDRIKADEARAEQIEQQARDVRQLAARMAEQLAGIKKPTARRATIKKVKTEPV